MIGKLKATGIKSLMVYHRKHGVNSNSSILGQVSTSTRITSSDSDLWLVSEPPFSKNNHRNETLINSQSMKQDWKQRIT